MFTSMPDLGRRRWQCRRLSGVKVSLPFAAGHGSSMARRRRRFRGRGTYISQVCTPHHGGWGGLDAGDEEDWRAGAAWSAPASKKREVRPQLRTITTIRYRFHLKPLCEESFFGLGSVLAPWCSGDRLVDDLVKMAAFPVSTGDPWDLLVFCCFSRVIYVVWLQSLYPPYPLRRRLYWYVFMDVFLTV